MNQSLAAIKGSLTGIHRKMDVRRATVFDVKTRLGRDMSAIAGVESGLRSDVSAIAGLLQKSQTDDAYRAMAKTQLAQKKANEVMVALNIAIKRIDELNGLIIPAATAIKDSNVGL